MAASYQLMAADTASGVDVPVLDHVVALAFEYFGDPQPPLMRRPPSSSSPRVAGPPIEGAAGGVPMWVSSGMGPGSSVVLSPVRCSVTLALVAVVVSVA